MTPSKILGGARKPRCPPDFNRSRRQIVSCAEFCVAIPMHTLRTRRAYPSEWQTRGNGPSGIERRLVSEQQAPKRGHERCHHGIPRKSSAMQQVRPDGSSAGVGPVGMTDRGLTKSGAGHPHAQAVVSQVTRRLRPTWL